LDRLCSTALRINVRRRVIVAARMTKTGNREPLLSAIHPLDEFEAAKRGACGPPTSSEGQSGPHVPLLPIEVGGGSLLHDRHAG
jgi:hypothetical protein